MDPQLPLDAKSEIFRILRTIPKGARALWLQLGKDNGDESAADSPAGPTENNSRTTCGSHVVQFQFAALA